MTIHFSRHAKRQMKWRGISEREVTDVMVSPEQVENSIKHRKNAFKHIGKKWLKVTFIQEREAVTIVTVIDKSA